MRAFDHAVVALALDRIDHDVLRHARRVHELAPGEIRFTFVHVLPSADVAALREPAGPSRDEARRAVEAAVAEHFGTAAGVEIAVRSGDPIDELLELAAESAADLVLVGHRRATRGRRSVARRLAMNAPASLWMVPEGAPARIGRVVVAVDFSLPSAEAVGTATWIAARAGLGTCTVLHVAAPSGSRFDGPDDPDLDRTLAKFLSPLDLHGVDVEVRIVEGGSVAGALAEGAPGDLVVLGTRGLSASAAVLLGSESEQVLLESRVPVLVTKERGERIGLVRTLLDRGFAWPPGPKFG